MGCYLMIRADSEDQRGQEVVVAAKELTGLVTRLYLTFIYAFQIN